jgi:hypothetical protein
MSREEKSIEASEVDWVRSRADGTKESQKCFHNGIAGNLIRSWWGYKNDWLRSCFESRGSWFFLLHVSLKKKNRFYRFIQESGSKNRCLTQLLKFSLRIRSQELCQKCLMNILLHKLSQASFSFSPPIGPEHTNYSSVYGYRQVPKLAVCWCKITAHAVLEEPHGGICAYA